MIDYAVEYVFYTRPEELLRECADAEQKPDMYILDIEMPGMDGLAAVSYTHLDVYKRQAKTVTISQAVASYEANFTMAVSVSNKTQ